MKLLQGDGTGPQAMNDNRRSTQLSDPAVILIENSFLVNMYAEPANSGADINFPNDDGERQSQRLLGWVSRGCSGPCGWPAPASTWLTSVVNPLSTWWECTLSWELQKVVIYINSDLKDD